jgi:AraC-like DNA-binding protein
MPKKYASEFRSRILSLVAEGRPIAEIAETFGVSSSKIYAWRKQDRIDRGEIPGTTTTEAVELAAVRRRGVASGGISGRGHGHASGSAILEGVLAIPNARHLLRAKALMDCRYFEQLDASVLADTARLSPAYFRREFRRTFGETPHHYLLTRRLERAAALLRNTDRQVADICVSVGLTSVGSFTTSFSRYFGCSPTAYRAKFPPAADRIRIPACVLQAWGRPFEESRFREDNVEQTV